MILVSPCSNLSIFVFTHLFKTLPDAQSIFEKMNIPPTPVIRTLSQDVQIMMGHLVKMEEGSEEW
jgi:hypothetical protein